MCNSCKVKSCSGVAPVKSKLIIVPEPTEVAFMQIFPNLKYTEEEIHRDTCGSGEDAWIKCDACPTRGCGDCMCNVLRWAQRYHANGKPRYGKMTKKDPAIPAEHGDEAAYYTIDNVDYYEGKENQEGTICKTCFVLRFGADALFER